MSIADVLISLLFFASAVGLIASREVIKSIICMMLMQTSVVLFWLHIGARDGNAPPIIPSPEELEYIDGIADPLPQALMITAIVIGISVTAVIITMLNNLIRKYKTDEWKALLEKVKEEHGEV